MDDALTAQQVALELDQARLAIAALRAQLADGAVSRLTDPCSTASRSSTRRP